MSKKAEQVDYLSEDSEENYHFVLPNEKERKELQHLKQLKLLQKS